jgi:hypothetical protein
MHWSLSRDFPRTTCPIGTHCPNSNIRLEATIVIGHLAVSKLSASTSTLQLMLQCMSATTVIVHSEASKLSTNTSALLLTLHRTNGHLAGVSQNSYSDQTLDCKGRSESHGKGHHRTEEVDAE